jgi:adenylylsulfate kinase-like enzyme
MGQDKIWPIIWLTGQPGSGKTAISVEILKRFWHPEDAIHIDGDDLRVILGNPGYGEAGRRQNIQNAQNLAKFLQAKNFRIIVSLIAPYKDQREALKASNKVLEVYCHTTQIRGKEAYFVKEYDPPTTDFVDINTDRPIEECVDKILSIYWLVPR